jgi:hypothetical protein
MLFPHFGPSGSPWFVKGLNMPWMGYYGRDIGCNALLPTTTTSFDRNRLIEYLDRIHGWDIPVLRIWAFEKGEGLTWNDANDPQTITGLDQTFCDNVAIIIREARRRGIRIYWCLLDALNLLSRNQRVRLGVEFERGVVGGPAPRETLLPVVVVHGRHDYTRIAMILRRLVTDPGCKESYITQALLPFVDILRDPSNHPEQTLFGVDLANEPDALWRSTLTEGGGMTQNDVVSWLAEMASRVKDHLRDRRAAADSVLVSIGFGGVAGLRQAKSRLGDLDFFDFHAYDVMNVRNTSGNLPQYSSLQTSKPCIIGECGLGGQVQRRSRPRLRGAYSGATVTLDHLFQDQETCIRNYLRTACANGYAGCLVWEFGGQHSRVGQGVLLSHEATWADLYPLLWTDLGGTDLGARGQLRDRPAVRAIRDARCPPGP